MSIFLRIVNYCKNVVFFYKLFFSSYHCLIQTIVVSDKAGVPTTVIRNVRKRY